MLDETRVETSVLYNILPVMSKSGTDRVYIHWGERAGDHKGPLRHSSPHSPLREPNFPRKDGEPKNCLCRHNISAMFCHTAVGVDGASLGCSFTSSCTCAGSFDYE